MNRVEGAGRLVDNVVHFARLLRRAGCAVGPDRVLVAVAALQCVGVARRADVHAALGAAMLDRHEQQPLFDAAFAAFWHEPTAPGLSMTAPRAAAPPEGTAPRVLAARLEEAWAARQAHAERPETPEEPSAGHETTLTHSERERLQGIDFETMTVAEFDAARRLAANLPPPVRPVALRRHTAAARGRIDLRATLRAMMRTPQVPMPRHVQPRRERPPVVVLLDISGSMERYARLFLHYVHGLMQRHHRVQAFTFGTRLTPITHALRHRDPDDALAATAAQVRDWRGGTRIASSLAEFNRLWARRVLGRNAALLLVSDGLDRDEQGNLGLAAARLARQAHEFVWLNPLLRFEGFEPRAAGVRALLPHVDRFLPVHNLASLRDLGRALVPPAPGRAYHRAGRARNGMPFPWGPIRSQWQHRHPRSRFPS